MSRALETLARLQRAQIDELRIALAGVGAARDTVAAKDGAKVSEMAHEAALVAPADAPAFGAYAGRVLGERRVLAQEDARLLAREEELREEMRLAFQELKKIEQLIASQAERERLAENARELAAMDEAAIMQATRRG
mgnify:CR=1 FL=1